jgi:CDP-glycerol glycerophosphotransferase
VLLRGHRFHAARPGAGGETGARIVDVTSYPEVNDLILAADVAVLDYSSLRFDVALTGRPMLFLVPDLDRYAGEVRGFLLDFRDTAPGPLLGSSDEVVDRLGDLAAVRAEHAASYERFNRKYNYLQDGHSAERVVDAFFGAG